MVWFGYVNTLITGISSLMLVTVTANPLSLKI